MTAQGYVPMRSAQPATYPVGFNFKTDERIKNPETHVQEPKIKDFTKSLREALPQSTVSNLFQDSAGEEYLPAGQGTLDCSTYVT